LRLIIPEQSHSRTMSTADVGPLESMGTHDQA
jgi:hypothetical protein